MWPMQRATIKHARSVNNWAENRDRVTCGERVAAIVPEQDKIKTSPIDEKKMEEAVEQPSPLKNEVPISRCLVRNRCICP